MKAFSKEELIQYENKDTAKKRIVLFLGIFAAVVVGFIVKFRIIDNADKEQLKLGFVIFVILSVVAIIMLQAALYIQSLKRREFIEILVNTISDEEYARDELNKMENSRKEDSALYSLISLMVHGTLREKNLELSKRSAQLDSLQQQINPHFLYNTLDTIRGQARISNQRSIEAMALNLSKIFRYSISNHSDLVSLNKELEVIDSYLYIQNARFNGKFSLVFEINDGMEYERIPKMTLQPIVENAIHHGLETKTEKGIITIKANKVESRCVIQVIDNGVGIAPDRLIEINSALRNMNNPIIKKESGHSIGVTNINSRLRIIYGNEAIMTVYSVQDVGTTIEISIPLSKD